MDAKFESLVERCQAIGVQVEFLAEFGYYWFVDSNVVAPSRIFDTEEEAWESAAQWFFTGVEFNDNMGASV